MNLSVREFKAQEYPSLKNVSIPGPISTSSWARTLPDGRAARIAMDLLASETVLGRLEDPSRDPELDGLRRTLPQWRFYHGLRTDAASPLRQPCAAVAMPTLASDGSDLPAVFATLAFIRQDTVDLERVIDQSFPGATIVIPAPDRMASFGILCLRRTTRRADEMLTVGQRSDVAKASLAAIIVNRIGRACGGGVVMAIDPCVIIYHDLTGIGNLTNCQLMGHCAVAAL